MIVFQPTRLCDDTLNGGHVYFRKATVRHSGRESGTITLWKPGEDEPCPYEHAATICRRARMEMEAIRIGSAPPGLGYSFVP